MKTRSDGTVLIMWNALDVNGNFQVVGRFVMDFNSGTMSDIIQFTQNEPVSQILPTSIVFSDNTILATWTDGGVAVVAEEVACTNDCQLSQWSLFSVCSTQCNGGTQTRQRQVISQPILGGLPCGPLIETQACNTQLCSDPSCSYCFGQSCYTFSPALVGYSEAVSECSSVTGCPSGANCLVSVDDINERSFLVRDLLSSQDFSSTPAWIESWQGQEFTNLCLSMSVYGAISVPNLQCNDTLATICEFPRPSNCNI